MTPEIIGFASGIIASLSILPQIHKSWKSGSSDDLSTNMIVLMYIALILAIIYGVMIQHSAVYISNSISLIFYIMLHSIKIYNIRKKIKDVYIQIETDTENDTDTDTNT